MPGDARPPFTDRRDAVAVALVTTLAAAMYAFRSLEAFARFRAGAYDLVIFDQAVRGYSRLGEPISALKGVHNGFGPHFSVLGDHWSPALAALAPLYRLHDGPRTLLVAQAVLFALAVPFLWAYAHRAFGGTPAARWAAYATAVAYALSWPVAEAVAFDFHEVAFVPLLTAAALERHQAGRRGAAAAAALGLLLVKEDMGLLVAGIGLVLLTRRGERRAGALLVAAGAAALWLTTWVLIPAAGGRPGYYWAYGPLGRGPGEALAHAVAHPGDALALLATPPAKAATALLLVAPALLTPLLSPITLALLPPLLERLLASGFPNWWSLHYHYNAFVVVVAFAGGVDGARRLARRFPRPDLAVRWWAGLTLAVCLAGVPFFAFGPLLSPAFYARTPRTLAAARAVAAVPDGVLVEATDNLAPALSARTRTLLWDRTPRWAPWVVADVRRRTFPFASREEQAARVRSLLGHGYRVVFREAGYRVLTRDLRPR
ncbi:DUF2079 domain-containing protein [Microbispora corallina]|uniref:DUF2079 domain-containing protein n=1 Tax=Microbispora corallina TaxID=83302 RepID=A0ABQ4G502_9ACTN|nr:DUF2079 domain-containing protein [Microbispora corallina]GIH42139.1 hypothetical protein Mco01_51390 [Microbispora corallina]